MAFFKTAKKILADFFSEFMSNKVPKLAAALAYYTVFSLPALLIIIIWVSDIFYGQQAVERKLYKELASLVGPDTAITVQETIRNTTLSNEGYVASIIGIVTLVIGATGIFAEIQDSINQVWHLKAKPKKGKGLVKMLIDRLLSFSMIAVLGFLLLVSLVVNSIMDIFMTRFAKLFPDVQVFVLYGFNFIFTFLIIAFLFGVIFKVLPDARIRWHDVKPGVSVTAGLFMIGKFFISFYLGKSTVSTSYGAAGSVLIILVWVYYSAIILYIGAIFTRVYALHRGSQIYPSKYAVWVEKKELETREALPQAAAMKQSGE